MARFTISTLSLLTVLLSNGFACADGQTTVASDFFDGYYAVFVDRSTGELPYFVHKTSGERLYLGKDIPLANLAGYRFKKLRINEQAPESVITEHTTVINENSALKDLFFEPDKDPTTVTMLCVYSPDGTLIDKKCTDRYFDETHTPEFKKPKDYFYDFDRDFHVTWIGDQDDNGQLPFFRNTSTRTDWYLGRDLPLSALQGYRLRVRPINMHGDISKGGLDIRIDDKTTINDLMFRLADPQIGGNRHTSRICLYNPNDVPIGHNKSCTDPFYGHNYYPYITTPSDYGYSDKILSVAPPMGPKQDFIEDYTNLRTEIPANADIIFALRFFHNGNTPLVVNLSDAYRIELGRYQATITDLDSDKEYKFAFHDTHSNITLGLTVSREANYKQLRMIEDSGGQLDSENALELSDIVTDDKVIDRIFNEPFYRLENPTNTPIEFILLNANVYVNDPDSHHISKRCLEHHPVIKFLKGMLLSYGITRGSVCGPPRLELLNQSHASPLETDVTHAHPQAAHDTVGYILQHSLNLKHEDAAAFLTAINHCRLDANTVLKQTRSRRAPSDCFKWTRQLTTLTVALGLNISDMINRVIDRIVNIGVIPGDAYPGGSAPTDAQGQEDQQQLIATVREVGREQAIAAVTQYGAISSQAALAYPEEFLASETGQVRSEPEVQQTVADGVVGLYRLNSVADFRPLANEVRRVNSDGRPTVQRGQEYTTQITYITPDNFSRHSKVIEEVQTHLTQWITALHKNASALVNANERRAINMIQGIQTMLRFMARDLAHQNTQSMILGLVYSPDNQLIGVSIGEISHPPGQASNELIYHSYISVVRPEDLRNQPGTYRGAVAYLRSEMLRLAFSKGTDRAETEAISPYSAKTFYKLGFRKEEL